MKEYKHLGAYGVIIKDGKIALIKKVGGPYDGKLDLPGGTIEFGETPEETLIRELKEEVGIEITNFKLIDASSTVVEWIHKEELHKVHHIALFYNIIDYKNKILNSIDITKQNDDSMGAEFYDIDKLNKNDLSDIAILILEKLGYKL